LVKGACYYTDGAKLADMICLFLETKKNGGGGVEYRQLLTLQFFKKSDYTEPQKEFWGGFRYEETKKVVNHEHGAIESQISIKMRLVELRG